VSDCDVEIKLCLLRCDACVVLQDAVTMRLVDMGFPKEAR
jgi:hypothetical protein